MIDATSFFVKMRKSRGNKRNEISDGQEGKPDHVAEITRICGDFEPGEHSKMSAVTDPSITTPKSAARPSRERLQRRTAPAG